jgi:hypothetical protein
MGRKRNLDVTTTRRQWRDIIARRTARLIEAANKVSDAISAGKPLNEVIDLRREAIESLIRLCEGTTQNLREGLDIAFRDEMDKIYLEAEQ